MNRYKIAIDDKTVHVDANSMDEAIAMANERLAAVNVDDVGRVVGEGLPVVGGMLNTMNAATNTVLSYLYNPINEALGREYAAPRYQEGMGDDKSFGERFDFSKAEEDAKTERLAAEHPAVTQAGNTVGNILGTAAMFKAAPGAFSTGKPGMFNLGKDILKGGATTGGISAADTFVRTGGDWSKAAESGLVGFGTGVAGTVALRPIETAVNIGKMGVNAYKNAKLADPALWTTGEGKALAEQMAQTILQSGGNLKPAAIEMFKKFGPSAWEATLAAAKTPAERQMLAPLIRTLALGQAGMEISQNITQHGGGGF